MTPWKHQTYAVRRAIEVMQQGGRRILVATPTGGGKCFGRGTTILMFDGTIRPVENIAVGDLLMGPDSKPRTVLSLARGHEAMYRVAAKSKRHGDESYVVNESHTLSLMMTPEAAGKQHTVENITVKEYLTKSKSFRHRAKGYRAAVDFPHVDVPVDPYFLGLWLSDGTATATAITKPDPEVIATVNAIAESYGLTVHTSLKGGSTTNGTHHITAGREGSTGQGKNKNPLLNQMRDLKVIGNKHIPHSYLVNSRDVRLELLAGILDGDGYYHHGGYDYCSVLECLADGVIYLCRSLGLAAYKHRRTTKSQHGIACDSFRVSISGDCTIVPCRIARRKAEPRLMNKDVKVYGFTVEPIGEGDYYGFEIDGDHLFMLGDFTVTHNSKVMRMLIEELSTLKFSVYTNRRMLLTQTSDNMDIDHGIRAAGHKNESYHRVQVAMMQSEFVGLDKKPWHNADVVLIDEAHLQRGNSAEAVLNRHRQNEATLIGFSATPIDLGHMYDTLIQAGTTSELRECGALVKALHYAPDEPDLKRIGRVALGEDLSESQNVKAIMVHGVFGRVLKHYQRLNPEQKPTILFAPGVKESIWFAEQFNAAGIRSAHIDGENCWIDGQLHQTTDGLRKEIGEGSKDGSIKVVCNRFVLREGIDWPWIEHGIFATIFGSLQSYLQSGGRELRASPSTGKTHCIIQDHGGNYWRHGSLNADREWDLTYTAAMYAGQWEDKCRGGKEPFRCPKCTQVLASLKCPCGFVLDIKQRSRPVVQADGSLIEMRGEIFKPIKYADPVEQTQKDWQKMYYRAKNGNMTFRQAFALFAAEHNWRYPPLDIPLMPKMRVLDFSRVADVPRSELR